MLVELFIANVIPIAEVSL